MRQAVLGRAYGNGVIMEPVHLNFVIDGEDFTSAGEAAGEVKRVLRWLGFDSETIKRCAICMYEGEINMVIHANGGVADVYIDDIEIKIILTDRGPGIPDIELAVQEGYTTATQTVRELGFGAGMGLPNMKKYADELVVTSEIGVGTTITMFITPNEEGK